MDAELQIHHISSRGRLTEGCLATNQETAGSNPALEASCRGSPIGRAPASEAGGEHRTGEAGRDSAMRCREERRRAACRELEEQRASTPTVGGSSPPCGAIPSIPSTPEESCSSASPSPAALVPATSVASGPMPPGTGARSSAMGQPMAPSAARAAYAGRPHRRPRVSARSYKPSKP